MADFFFPVLAKLIASESVRIIYALNRRSKNAKGVLERQKDALKSRGYDSELASSPKVVLLEGELTGTGLGLDPALEDKVWHLFNHLCEMSLTLRLRYGRKPLILCT